MNHRLEAIFSLISPGRGVIDVGTDHGILPARLCRSGYTGHVFASDIKPGPLSAARATAERLNISDAVTFLLCDGLEDCPPDAIDTIVIAGMGGDSICGILDRAEWCMDPAYALILQPMTKAEVLRFWLVNNGFTIEKEELVMDGGTLYQILCARYIGKNTYLSDAELFLGSFELIGEHPLFSEYLEQLKARFQARIDGLLSGEKQEEQELCFLREILREMNAIGEQ